MRNSNTNAAASHDATFKIVGTIDNVYEGKKNYVAIKVPKDDEYYSMITVTADPSIELYNDGAKVEVDGTISSYFDNNIRRTIPIFNVDTIKPVS